MTTTLYREEDHATLLDQQRAHIYHRADLGRFFSPYIAPDWSSNWRAFVAKYGACEVITAPMTLEEFEIVLWGLGDDWIVVYCLVEGEVREALLQGSVTVDKPIKVMFADEGGKWTKPATIMLADILAARSL